MIAAIAREQHPSEARDLLNVLRAARQEHPYLRLVLTGSIGLHHVLSEVRDGSWAPVNDLATITVQPLDAEHANDLALSLLVNECVQCNGRQVAVGAAVASLAEGVPYYIHLLIAGLKRRGHPINPDDVRTELAAALDDPQDPWSLRHLERRLDDYYGDIAPIAAALLDALASTNSPVDFASLLRIAKARDQELQDRTLRHLLDALQRDHYVVRDSDGFRFRLVLLRSVWRSLRYIDVKQ